jgi:hypothetical protein
MNLCIIENFYENPEAVRKLALHAEYINVSTLNYPGLQTKKSFSSIQLENRFSKALNRKLDIDKNRHTFGKFRVMTKETGSALKVHLDGHSDWTGLIYLTPPKLCLGGTAFYRHKATGLDGPLSDKLSQNLGYKNWLSCEKAIISKDTNKSSAWEQVDFIAMKFNRLVIFKGNEMFHCHTHSFGSCIENARMTQNFFFNEKKIK